MRSRFHGGCRLGPLGVSGAALTCTGFGALLLAAVLRHVTVPVDKSNGRGGVFMDFMRKTVLVGTTQVSNVMNQLVQSAGTGAVGVALLAQAYNLVPEN